MKTETPLTLEQCKDTVANIHIHASDWNNKSIGGWVHWVKYCSPSNSQLQQANNEAAELYKDSAVASLKEENEKLRETLQDIENCSDEEFRELPHSIRVKITTVLTKYKLLNP
jgi:hypothetical protein